MQSGSQIEEYDDANRSGIPTRGQTMGVMSGMTAGSATMGTATAGSHADNSKFGTYSGLRSSENYNRGKPSHSMRPGPMRSGLGMEYQSSGGPTRL